MIFTVEEIGLLRKVFAWARANGFRWTEIEAEAEAEKCGRCRVWESGDRRCQVHVWDRLETSDDLGVFVKRDNFAQGLELRNVREIVDVLCVLGVLPAWLSSLHTAGVESIPWHYGVETGANMSYFGENLARALAYAAPVPVEDYPQLTVLRWRQGPPQIAVIPDEPAGREGAAA